MEKREDTIRKLRIYAILMRAMEIEAERNNTCVLHGVVGSQFTDLKKTEPFLIKRLPEFKEPWIDPNEPVFNQHKHMLSCHKSRKKRKKKKHR